MYELIRAIGNTYYIDCPSKIGVVKLAGSNVCLIDSGNNRDTGKKIKKILDSEGWFLRTILVTHAHADHIGGNKYLSSQYGCRIFAHEAECSLTRHTILQPSFLYGANPPVELRHKFLLAEESETQYLADAELPEGISAFEIPGHTFNMVGYLTSDGAAFIGDCLSSKETLDKYGVGYIYNIEEYLASLEKVKRLDAKIFIPSHAPATDNITPLADYNIKKVNEVCDKIVQLTATPKTTEQILAGLFEAYGLTMNFEQYALVGSALKSYLTYLASKGLIIPFFNENTLLFERI